MDRFQQHQLAEHGDSGQWANPDGTVAWFDSAIAAGAWATAVDPVEPASGLVTDRWDGAALTRYAVNRWDGTQLVRQTVD